MKTFLLCSAILAAAAAANFNPYFEEFKATHGKSYGSSSEELFRRQVFAKNYQTVMKHNKEAAAGLHSYTRTWNNQFADEVSSAVAARLNGIRLDLYQTGLNASNRLTFLAPANVDLPKEIDWRKLGAVTEVKNQGQCGSCWAFSATGTLEGVNFRKTGKLVSLSEQQLVDCSRGEEYQNEGCNGGLPSKALKYIHDNHGIDTEESYPYHADEEKCHFRADKVGATDKSVVEIPQFDEQALMAAVATQGPVSVAIDASHDSFMHYNSGVYEDPECSSTQLDHGVLAVGYGHDEASGKDYWLVKNSWGLKWGEGGYIRMVRNKKNHCGIASMAVYPLV